VVHAGAADSMRYNAPNAGYTNTFEALPAGGAVPGFTVQTPYAPVVPNPACGMKGGSKRRSKRGGSKRGGSKRGFKRHVRFNGGAESVAENAGAITPLHIADLQNRSAFDGSKGGLPVKFGGGRRTKRHYVSKRRGTRHCLTGKIRNFFGL